MAQLATVSPVSQVPLPHSGAVWQSIEQLAGVSPSSHVPLPHTGPAGPQSWGQLLLLSVVPQVPSPQVSLGWVVGTHWFWIMHKPRAVAALLFAGILAHFDLQTSSLHAMAQLIVVAQAESPSHALSSGPHLLCTHAFICA
jgi:hypothetical protein